ncbi:MAG: molybdopterin-dependent oxidoreductase, partial [Candidatus Aminicenantes bacterium]|nr:molybdopterin-dependent oxidoreductase [Candidatus Aminicenantes bacterium]
MKLSIDGRIVEARDGWTILEAAREAGIAIPSLCDHPGLEPFGGCRLCLVEVRGHKALLPSCTVRAEEGMEVATNTPRLKDLRRRILELILSEHPYACLVCGEKDACDEMKSTIRKVGETTGCVLCSRNGRCELQRVCADLGVDAVSLPAAYRNRDVRKDDPFFDRDPNLCIFCGRCVRVCDEVRGASVLTFLDRGPSSEVGTAFDRTLLEAGCQFCGACVDVCPTGSLVDRGSRPDLRPDREALTVCPLCGHGCELIVEVRAGRVLASRPSANGPANSGQACVKGRFAVRAVFESPKRLTRPMVRKDGTLVPVEWEEALEAAAAGLKRFPPNEVAFLASDQVRLEDAFLFAELAQRFHGARARGGPAPAAAGGVVRFDRAEIAAAGTIILFGLDLLVSRPIVWLEVVKAVRRGAVLAVVDTGGLPPYRQEALRIRVDASEAEAFLAGLCASSPSGSEASGPRRAERHALLDLTKNRLPGLLLFDAEAFPALPSGVRPSGLRAIPLLAAVGSNGLRLAGIPAGSAGAAKAVVSLGSGPGPDDGRPEFLILEQCFLDEGAPAADVCLPAASFLETGGTYLNLEGRVLRFEKVLDPPGQAKPDAWILLELARKLGLEGLSDPAETVRTE